MEKNHPDRADKQRNFRPPRQFSVRVTVTTTLGDAAYEYIFIPGGQKADKIVVRQYDTVEWYVRVRADHGYITPPYVLVFDDPTIFGTPLIAVPQGGASGFCTVVASSTPLTKYSLAVSGVLPISDPQIQVDPNGDTLPPEIDTSRGVQTNVRWTVGGNVMEYQTGSGPWKSFPNPDDGSVNISAGDKVQFFGVIPSSADFAVTFPANLNRTIWSSPFDPLKYSFRESDLGENESTDNLTVADTADARGTRFIFQATLQDGSVYSDPFAFTLT